MDYEPIPNKGTKAESIQPSGENNPSTVLIPCVGESMRSELDTEQKPL